MRKAIVSFIFVFCTIAAAYAQIDPTVEVSRAYNVQLSEIAKPQLRPFVADSLKRFDISFDYSIFDRPYMDLYDFVPYQMTELEKAASVRHPFIAAKIGVQYPLMPDASVYAQFVNNPNFNASLYVLHNSLLDSLSAVNEGRYNSFRLKNQVGANFRGAWTTGEINADFSYRMSNAKDGYNPGTPLTGEHGIRGLDIILNAKSAYKEDNSLFYDIDLEYSNSNANKKLGIDTVNHENMLDIAASLGASFEGHRIYVNIRTKNEWLTETSDKVLGIVEITPMYEYRSDKVKAKVGVKFGNKYGRDEATDIAPDVRVRVEAVKKILWVRASVTGGNDLVTLSDVAYDLPWMVPDIQFSKVPVAGELGIESVLWSRLAINVLGAYSINKNGFRLMPDFTSSGLPYLKPYYSDYNKWTVGGDVSWKSQSLKVAGSFRYNGYKAETDSALFMLPSIESSVNLEYNYRRRVFASVGFSYLSSMTFASEWCKTGVIPDFIDLNCRVDYMINKHFSIFVKGGNLLNRKHYRYAGISSERINVGGGIGINF